MLNLNRPRNVIYYNDNKNSLADLANTAYTDVIFGFMAVDANMNVSGDGGAFDDNLDNNIVMLQKSGKNVLVSLGGDDKTFPSATWQACAQTVLNSDDNGQNALVTNIVNFVSTHNFNGIDIDYEDNNGFTGVYDGVQFLILLTGQLSRWLPPDQNVITHAPQTPYWDASQWTNGAYVSIAKYFQQFGDIPISWFNNQFYDQGDYNNALKYYPQFANIVPPEKMLVGALLSGSAADGYIGLDAMMNVITTLTEQYPNNPNNPNQNFGGAMGWQFSLDTPNGAWGDGIAQALGLAPAPVPNPLPTPGPTSGSWSVNDLTAATDAPAAAGDPNGFTFTANGTSGMHVVYRGADDDIHELYWQNGAWGVNDLTAATGAPAAAGDPNGFTFTANGTSGMHVVYRGADDDIHELYWQNGAWGVNDLTAATGAPAAAGDPNGFTFTANGTSGMHVVYRGDDNDIHELYWQNGAWGVNDLTAATGAPAAAGDPNGFTFTANGTSGMHVVYRGVDNDVHELYWQDGAWGVNDLTAATGAPAAAGDPTGFAFTTNGTSGMHVVYRGVDNDVHELYWQDGAWGVNDLTAATGAPAAAGDPNGFTFTANGTSGMHVVYRGVDDDVHELYWQDGGWGINDLTAATGAPAAAGDPNGYVFDAQEQMHVVYPSADGHIDEFWWATASTSSAVTKLAADPPRYAKRARGKAPAEA